MGIPLVSDDIIFKDAIFPESFPLTICRFAEALASLNVNKMK